LIGLLALANQARADIYQWEYVNPADPSQGKRQSTLLAPDGAGVMPAPNSVLSNLDLTMAYLIGADLSNSNFQSATLKSAEVSGAKLNGANLASANLTLASFRNTDLSGAIFDTASLSGADLTGAQVRGASFGGDNSFFSASITFAQLSTTASYQAHNLATI
jgi:uncharacterized protein YjbI with pentapeptide repeats